MLFERAKQYEDSSFKGLYNFINFIDKLKLGSGDLGSAKLIGENDDVIRIICHILKIDELAAIMQDAGNL